MRLQLTKMTQEKDVREFCQTFKLTRMTLQVLKEENMRGRSFCDGPTSAGQTD